METSAFITALQAEGELLAQAAGTSGPAPAVPTCPDWLVRDLVHHVGGVHRWAGDIVSAPRASPPDITMEQVVGAWPPDDDLVDWFRAGHAALIRTLSDAPADVACWSFLPAPSPLTFWARRQAHETAIHRVDAQLSAGVPPTQFSPAFAADGIDELVAGFVTRRSGRLRSETVRTLRLHCEDTADSWLLSIGAEGVETTREEGRADCVVTGPASDLYQALWNRQSIASFDIAGDRDVLELFLDTVHVR